MGLSNYAVLVHTSSSFVPTIWEFTYFVDSLDFFKTCCVVLDVKKVYLIDTNNGRVLRSHIS